MAPPAATPATAVPADTAPVVVQPPQRLAAAGPDQADCARTRAKVAALAADGKTKVSCTERRAQAAPAAKDALRVAARNRDILPLPQWCIDNAFSGWWYTRTNACSIEDWILTVTDVRTGAVLGTMNFLVLNFSYTSTSIQTWAQQIEIRPYLQNGAAVGSSVQGTAACTGACTTGTVRFPSQPALNNTDAEGEAFFDTTAVAPGAVGSASTTITFWFTNPTWAAPSTPASVGPPQVRCDNATPGASSIGCVFPDYTPAWVVSLTQYPNFGRHVRDAQNSGLPGAYPDGTPLTRLTDATLSRRNGDTACPDSYPRPSGYSCDEYPFRSTWQGAFTGGGSGRC